MFRATCVFLLCLVLLSGCKWRVIDGDSLALNLSDSLPEIQYRLEGIDAPEKHQKCRTWGLTWDCGKAAMAALETRTEDMVCAGTETDKYGRVLGSCYQGGEDVNAWMVAQGWAVAYLEYSKDYADEEADAEAARRGIHRGQFIPPADWRKGDRLEGEDTFASVWEWEGEGMSPDEQLAHDLLWGNPTDFSGVLMNESVFGLDGDEPVSFGAWHQAAPTGVGRVEWRGHAFALDATGDVSRGTAVIDIDDLAEPDVDVVLSGLPRAFTWTDVPIIREGAWEGAFRASDESMGGMFYGSEQEEVGGVFDRDGWVGAFGGTKVSTGN